MPPIDRRTVLAASVLAGLGSLAPAAVAQAARRRPPTRHPGSPGHRTPGTCQATRTVGQWEALYLAHAVTERATQQTRSLSGDSWQLYDLGYGIDGATAMAEATGNTSYLDDALTWTENAISTAVPSSSLVDPRYRDSYLGWVSTTPSQTPGEEVPLYEFYCWRYVSRLLRVIRHHAAWYGDPLIRARYDAILAFSEEHVFEKWWLRAPRPPDTHNLYRSVTHIAAHSAYTALNLRECTTSAARVARYTEVINAIDVGPMPNYPSSLRDQLIVNTAHPNAFFWNWTWGSTSLPGSDVSHGNAVVAYVLDAVEYGQEWTTADIRKLCATLTEVVWPDPTSTIVRAYYMDGSGTSSGTGGTFINDGFWKLGRHDCTIQARLESYDAPVRNSLQMYGHGALNAATLGLL